jgi:glucose-6-phosphate isomerase, archaeal
MTLPFTFDLVLPGMIPTKFDNHIIRKLTALNNQFADSRAYEILLAKDDTTIYEVYEIKLPEQAGQLLHGISIVHPGKVGDEYFMTKGHFHIVVATAEIYYCLKGEGMMVMETPEGESSVAELHPGCVLYVPPRWAHRSVNTGKNDLVTFFIYPGNAGHDYGTIETKGFRKLVVERDGIATIIANPRWTGKKEKE